MWSMGDLPRGDKMDRLKGKRTICVIVQARMGSTRLPGKVMKDIVGKPLVLHVVERIKRITPKDTVVIATTTLKEDDTIVDAVTNYDTTINIYRGSSQDVLDRYYRAAIHCRADVIVRVTADNPLIDPDISGTVIETFLKNQCDYCCNNMPRTYPHGLDTEVFSFESLERAWKKAHTPYEREHVTPYIREHPGEFTLLNVEHTTDLSNLRWSVDYCEDFAFVTEIYKRLYFKNKTFAMEDVLDILDKEPWLCEMNEVVP